MTMHGWCGVVELLGLDPVRGQHGDARVEWVPRLDQLRSEVLLPAGVCSAPGRPPGRQAPSGCRRRRARQVRVRRRRARLISRSSNAVRSTANAGSSATPPRPRVRASAVASSGGVPVMGPVSVGGLDDEVVGWFRVLRRQQQRVIWPTQVAAEDDPGLAHRRRQSMSPRCVRLDAGRPRCRRARARDWWSGSGSSAIASRRQRCRTGAADHGVVKSRTRAPNGPPPPGGALRRAARWRPAAPCPRCRPPSPQKP